MTDTKGWKEKIPAIEDRARKRIASNQAKKKKKKVYKIGGWQDLYYVWVKCWEKRFKDIVMPRWGKKEAAMAKKLIEKIGIGAAETVVVYMFENWGKVAWNAKRLGGIPSLKMLLGTYETFYMNAMQTAKKKNEVDEMIADWRRKQK